MGVVYGTSNLLLKSAFGTFGDLRVSGKENVPRRGALIVVANHLSDIDPALLNACIPRKVRYMAKAEFFEKPVVPITTLFFNFEAIFSPAIMSLKQ